MIAAPYFFAHLTGHIMKSMKGVDRMFRQNTWKAVDEAMAEKLLDLDPTDEEYGTAVKNYRILKEAKGEKPRCKLDPNVVLNAGVILGSCLMTIYGESILHQVVYSKFWPKILLPKL